MSLLLFKFRGAKGKLAFATVFLLVIGYLHYYTRSLKPRNIEDSPYGTIPHLPPPPPHSSYLSSSHSSSLSEGRMRNSGKESHVEISAIDSHAYWSKVFGIFASNPFKLTGEALDKAITYNKIEPNQFIEGTKAHLQAMATVDPDFWPDFKVKHANVLSSLPKEIPKKLYKEGTYGIAIVGGGRFSWLAYLAIRAVRDTGCDLPVEVLIPTAEDYELERSWCEKDLVKVNAKCVVLHEVLGPLVIKEWQEKITTYQYKLLAMMSCSFQHVLLLDSDNIILQDPRKVFDSELYSKYGMITWPDYWLRTISPEYYEALGIKVDETRRVRYRQYPLNPKHVERLSSLVSRKTPFHDFEGPMPDMSTEAGQIFVNKATHGGTLMLSLYYNVYGPKVFYKLFSLGAQGAGDKDTFVAAAVVLKQDFYQVKSKIHTNGYMDSKNKFQGVAMRQADPLEDFRLYQTKVVQPLFADDPAFKSSREQIKYLRNVDASDFSDRSNIGSFSLHCNFPKIDPLSYRDGILYDPVNIRLKHRAFGDLEITKMIEVNGQRAPMRMSFELDVWRLMRDILCDQKISFAYFAKTDMTWMCKFIDNQVSWLTEKSSNGK